LRLRILILAATFALPAGLARADIWVAPLPQGSNSPSCGTQASPCASISFAYTKVTVPGTTIRVKPGEYNDAINASGNFIEVSPGVFVDKWVNIIADNPNPALTTIVGDSIESVVRIGGTGGTLQGFTITGGGDSGVYGFGTVSIVGNVIQGNFGEYGGGIRIEPATCVYGPSVVTILNNVVKDNVADEDGGGVRVLTGVSPLGCQVAPIEARVEGNTISNNDAGDDAGGLAVLIDTFPNFESVEVTIRNNQINGNTALDEGGGARLQARGDGTETFVVTGNVLNGNAATGSGGGLALRLEPFEFANHRALVDKNTVTNNTAVDDAGGMLLVLSVDSLFQGQTYSLVASRNLVDHNVSTGVLRGGGGIGARYEAYNSAAADAALAEFKITGNTISFNDSHLRGGGVAAQVLTNRSSSCLVSGFPATAALEIENNMIVRNRALSGGSGGGVFASIESCLNSSSGVVLRLNTLTKNTTEAGAPGVNLQAFTDTNGAASFMCSHSIVWDNTGGTGNGLGGPTPPVTFPVGVEYSDINSYASWIGNRTGLLGNISTNPQFVNANGNNFHLNSNSPAIEAGSRLLGSAPPTDWEGSPRVVDRDKNGIFVVDLGADEFFTCTDTDLDGFGSPVQASHHCTLDNCPSLYNPGQSDCDGDSLGDVCDGNTVDADGDGVAAPCDLNDSNRYQCADLDNDSCDDCMSGVAYPANDGPDFDFDGKCDLGDPDDDGDGALDAQDAFPHNPFACGDADSDGCFDDCASGSYNPLTDGPDFDLDGLCNVGDPDDDNDGVPDAEDSAPLNATKCKDSDLDTCDDCTSGQFAPLNDGVDVDGDGRCAAGDSNDNNPNVCVDSDGDGCDDCTSGSYDPLADGTDTDLDGGCNLTDPDDDNDGVLDGSDCAPLTIGVSAPPGDVGPTVRAGPSKPRLSWVDIPNSHVFNIYRGLWLVGQPFAYGHICRLARAPGTEAMLEPDAPGPGEMFYYLVAGDNACGEGTLGLSSAGAERPNLAPCPATVLDSDGDGIVDADDNCVLGWNPGQADADSDTAGDACDNCSATSNVTQSNHDGDSKGDACDTCTDTDGDGKGDPGFPANTCPLDNCVHVPNSGQFDGDGDGLGNPCDPCPTDPGNDVDGDGICFAGDNCPDVFNPLQANGDGDGLGDACDPCTDTDGDGAGNGGYPNNTCPLDNCPSVANPSQGDADADFLGDACDACTDSDHDGFGDPGFPVNVCPTDNCPQTFNPIQLDTDGDVLGDACDPCFDNPNLSCLACPADADADGDGACHTEVVFVSEGSGSNYLANAADPGIPGIDWVAADYVPGAGWQSGVYGIGYDGQEVPNALALINTTVPADTLSIFTRADFSVADPGAALSIAFGADYDDGIVAWLNGVEIYRSPEMPAGDPAWDAAPQSHESSNHPFSPIYAPIVDVTAVAQPLLQAGSNVLALGVWNSGPASGDLVVVPRLSMLIERDNCPGLSNPDQADTDQDGLGEACDSCTDSDGDGFGDPGFSGNTCPDDNCPYAANPDQLDTDADTLGDACDVCPLSPENLDGDGDGVCTTNDNCPFDANPDQADPDLDGLGSACDNCPDHDNPGQADTDLDGLGDACDLCTDTDGDGAGDPGFPGNTCPDDNCPLDPNPDQADPDLDGLGSACDNCPDDDNPGQQDADLDELGDACDPCTDTDGDGAGDPAFPANTCPLDNCPGLANPGQADADGDLLGDACDPCANNPNLGCVLCPSASRTDPDADGVCDTETVVIEEASAMDYRANSSDPNIPGISWVAEGYVTDGSWLAGLYGVGYDTAASPPNAQDLITTPVDPGTRSIYTRATFDVPSLVGLHAVWSGADFDDAYIVWINGVEVFRSPEMTPGVPAWNQPLNSQKEASNQADPVYEPFTDVTAQASGALHAGTNVAAIGVWNVSSASSDLLLVPRLSLVKRVDSCPSVPNPSQADVDLDGVGDECDNCPINFNPGQGDGDLDGIGGACDTCTDSDGDGFGNPGYPVNTCPLDNCPTVPNPGQEDDDQDGIGNACDPTP